MTKIKNPKQGAERRGVIKKLSGYEVLIIWV
jgi:hypothetical protein